MSHKTILFIDNTYPEPYQLVTITEKALGGTESSIIRTAELLSVRYKVYVAQKYRKKIHKESAHLHFIPKSSIENLNPDFVIVLRKYTVLKEMSKLFPNAKIYLWIHTYKNYEYVLKRPGISKIKAQIICNSNIHKKQTNTLLNKTVVGKILSLFYKNTPIHYCYNPIEKPVHIKSERRPNKLLFFSSPNKGLKQVISKFIEVRKFLPDLELHIANPGYKSNDKDITIKNIYYLGSLEHDKMMQHVRESLCIFYPQSTFAETFGLIYAEANAHGTAIIAGDIGAAKEILSNENPPIDISNIKTLVQTIKNWQQQYPVISYNEKFSKTNIMNQWEKVFGSQ
ncbi:MAG: glycosyltransferase [Marinicellaceae bacterium]